MAETAMGPRVEADAGAVQGVLLAMPPCMVVITMVAPLPVIPAMLKAFAATPAIGVLAPMAVVLPMLAIALSSIAAGALGDRIGRRRLLNVSTLLFASAAVAPVWLTSFNWILGSRAVAGLCLGAMTTSAIGLTGDYFQGAARQKWLAVQGAAGAGSAVIASAISGALGEIGWRLPFVLLTAGFALFAALLLFRGPAIAAPGPQTEDVTGETSLPTPWTALAAIFALGVLASFIIWPPVYEFGLLLAEKGKGSAMVTGVMTAVLAVGAVAGAMGLGLVRHMPAAGKQAVAIAVSGLGIVVVWIATGLGPVLAGAFAIGVGEGMTGPILGAWLLDRTPLPLRGRVVGLFQTVFYLAQFAGPLFARWLAEASGGTTASLSYYAVAAAIVAASTGAAVLLRFMPRPRREHDFH
jgi:MFS family permease